MAMLAFWMIIRTSIVIWIPRRTTNGSRGRPMPIWRASPARFVRESREPAVVVVAGVVRVAVGVRVPDSACLHSARCAAAVSLRPEHRRAVTENPAVAGRAVGRAAGKRTVVLRGLQVQAATARGGGESARQMADYTL